MYTLALIMAGGVVYMGQYPTLEECNTQALSLREQKVKTACVRQPSPEEMWKQMAPLFVEMRKMLDQ